MQETNVVSQNQGIDAVASEVIPASPPTMTLCCYGSRLTRDVAQ
jgi:hypothetical protein